MEIDHLPTFSPGTLFCVIRIQPRNAIHALLQPTNVQNVTYDCGRMVGQNIIQETIHCPWGQFSDAYTQEIPFLYGSEISWILIAGNSPDISIPTYSPLQHNPFCLHIFWENKTSILSCNKITRSLDEHSIKDKSFLVATDFKIFFYTTFWKHFMAAG